MAHLRGLVFQPSSWIRVKDSGCQNSIRLNFFPSEIDPSQRGYPDRNRVRCACASRQVGVRLTTSWKCSMASSTLPCAARRPSFFRELILVGDLSASESLNDHQRSGNSFLLPGGFAGQGPGGLSSFQNSRSMIPSPSCRVFPVPKLGNLLEIVTDVFGDQRAIG